MKIVLRIFLGLVGLVVVTFGAALFYLSASLGVIDVPWLSDISDEVVAAEPEPAAQTAPGDRERSRESAPQESGPQPPLPPVRGAREIEEIIDLDLSDDDRFEIVLSESEINQFEVAPFRLTP